MDVILCEREKVCVVCEYMVLYKVANKGGKITQRQKEKEREREERARARERERGGGRN